MAEVGLLDEKDAADYFARFPQLLDQSVERNVLINPLTFERLLELMVAAKEEDFLIVSHGDPDTLLLCLTRTTRVTVGVKELDILETVEATRRDLPGAGTDLDRWRRLLRPLNIDIPPEIRDLDSGRVQPLQAVVEQWLDGTARGLGITRRSLDQLVALIERLHARKVGKVDFRGCNLGHKERVLARFRRFFGARRMRAPKVRSFFGTLLFSTHLNADAVRKESRRGGRIYGSAPDRVAVRIRYVTPNKAQLWSAAESESAAVDWVNDHVGPLTCYRRRVPLHWLQTNPPAFPRDDEYRLNLTTVTAPKP